MSTESVSEEDYRRLLELRTGLRKFLKWSADQAKAAGLTSAQHQLLLAIRGHDRSEAPTISEIAEHLQSRHHSTVELIDRAERDGIVKRFSDVDDARAVRVEITDEGKSRLDELSGQHLLELKRLAPRMAPLWAGLE